MKATCYQWEVRDKDGDRLMFTAGVIPELGDCFLTALYIDYGAWLWNDIVPGMTPKMAYDVVGIITEKLTDTPTTIPPDYYSKLQADYNLAQALLKKGNG